MSQTTLLIHSRRFLQLTGQHSQSRRVVRTTPNPAVSSILSQDCQLWLRWEKHPATFSISKFPPSKFHHLLAHQQLLSELHETCSLDLFDALNPVAASCVHMTTGCGSAIENILPLSDFRNSTPTTLSPINIIINYCQSFMRGAP